MEWPTEKGQRDNKLSTKHYIEITTKDLAILNLILELYTFITT